MTFDVKGHSATDTANGGAITPVVEPEISADDKLFRKTPFKTVKMQKKDVAKLPPYSAQRDTPTHEAALLKKPDWNPHNPDLNRGMMILNLGGRRSLGNGNTRMLMEKHGHITLDNELELVEYFPANKVHADRLYNSYDTAITSKTTKDRGVSALKYNNTPRSQLHPFFASGGYMSGLAFADAGTRDTATILSPVPPKDPKGQRKYVMDVVATWKKDIRGASDLMMEGDAPTTGVGVTAGIIAGLLVTVRDDPENAALFWPVFFKSKGQKGAAAAPENWLWHGVDLLRRSKAKHRPMSVFIRDQAIFAVKNCDKSAITKHDFVRAFNKFIKPKESDAE